MTGKPLVSVAILSYNNKLYLRECIESILNQNYPNLQIVVGDDASTDGSQELLQDLAAKHNNIHLILHKNNIGITNNSNAVHFACNGKYIAWMGGDDLMLPEKINTQVNYMERNPNCTITYHNLEVFDSYTNETLYFFNDKFKKSGNAALQVKYGTFNGACSVMIRRERAPAHGFDPRVPIASDYLFWVETLASGGTIDYLDTLLGKYRRHKKNVTSLHSDFAKQAKLDHLISLNIILQKYPQYTSEALYRFAVVLLDFRKDSSHYLKTVWGSIKVTPTKNAVGALLAYLLTFGKYKL